MPIQQLLHVLAAKISLINEKLILETVVNSMGLQQNGLNNMWPCVHVHIGLLKIEERQQDCSHVYTNQVTNHTHQYCAVLFCG